MIRQGTRQANWVYCMYDEGQEFMNYARERGLRCAVDVFINPLTPRIMMEEQARFPDFPADRVEADLVEEMERYVVGSLRLADLLTCPSEWVADGVRKLVPEAASKIRIVPYGTSLRPVTAKHARAWAGALRGSRFLAQGTSLSGDGRQPLEGTRKVLRFPDRRTGGQRRNRTPTVQGPSFPRKTLLQPNAGGVCLGRCVRAAVLVGRICQRDY